MTTILMQSEITGYQGAAVNLLAALDSESGLVIVSKELSPGERKAGAMIVSNDPRSETRDRLYTEDYFSDSIRSYFRSASSKMIELMPAVSKHDPKQYIETNGMGENGIRYRLNESVSNGNVAVLALVHSAEMMISAESANGMAEEMARTMYADDDYGTGFFTI